MRYYLVLPGLWILLLTGFSEKSPPSVRAFHLTGRAQGTTYHVTYYAGDSLISQVQVDSLFLEIDYSLSLYKPGSLINQFNESGSGIKMDVHLQRVVMRSLEIAEASHGIFDITVYPLIKAWGFGPDEQGPMPSVATIANLKDCIGKNMLYIQGDSLCKRKPCVQIDVNGIAQGYTVDVLADFIESKGIDNFLAELGGELRVKGRKQPGNQKFQIGIEAPAENEFDPEVLQKKVVLDSGALTTSGSYRKFRESNGKKIIHIIDPLTGYPVSNELISVTVYAKDAMTADGFDNTLLAMGLQQALHFLEERKDIAAYFIYRQENGDLADTATAEFYKLIK